MDVFAPLDDTLAADLNCKWRAAMFREITFPLRVIGSGFIRFRWFA